MKRLLKVVLLALTFATFAFAVPGAPESVLSAKESSVMLGRYDDDGIFTRYCSGAWLEGKVITAGHCVEGNVHPLIQMVDGYVYEGTVERAVKAWPIGDYAVVRVDIAPNLYPSLERGDGLQYGESLYAWSGPWGIGTLLLQGNYAGRVNEDMSLPNDVRGMHYTDMNAAGGSSGSLVLNEEGKVEAILVGAFGEDNRTLRLTGSLLVELPWW